MIHYLFASVIPEQISFDQVSEGFSGFALGQATLAERRIVVADHQPLR